MRRRFSMTFASSGCSRSNGPPGATRMRKKAIVTIRKSVGIAERRRRRMKRSMGAHPSPLRGGRTRPEAEPGGGRRRRAPASVSDAPGRNIRTKSRVESPTPRPPPLPLPARGRGITASATRTASRWRRAGSAPSPRALTRQVLVRVEQDRDVGKVAHEHLLGLEQDGGALVEVLLLAGLAHQRVVVRVLVLRVVEARVVRLDQE